jgi:poly[(R)-3-hydroxyalkanoate] polymerase subunit PhaC
MTATESTPIDITWEEVGPREEPEPRPELTSWEELDRRVRGRISEALTLAENHLASSSLGRMDALAAIPAFSRTAAALASDPTLPLQVGTKFATGMMRAFMAAGARAVGGKVDGPVDTGKDKRFADPTWSDNAAFWLLRQEFLVWERAMQELVEVAPVDEKIRIKVGFLTQAMVDSLSPTNSFLTNPAAMRRAVETGGLSVARGTQNFLDDLVNNGGQPQQFATGVYEVGRNMAVTPGKVVFRNDLMELIQYSPTTKTVHEIPLLFSPPWINKYYVMDLAPDRSLVQWAVDHGHTVFLISYRNPDESMRSVGMDDYLLSGPITALDVIKDITGQEKVNLLGLCLGGTLSMITLTYLDAIGKERINSATFLNTLTDFNVPGALGVFTDEASVAKLEVTMAKTGFLPADNMAKTFNMMRGNDLIWNYVVNNWMKGEVPPAFDLLTWNADSTRMPAEMHSFYLRSCYLENQLARGVMEIAGETLNIKSVDQDLYFLAAEQDHIAPWKSSYTGARLPSGDVRFVLSNSGHIAGIVNPPNPKSRHYISDATELPENPDEWLANSTMIPTTWWEDWATWIEPRAGKKIKPPTMGSDAHPVLGDAPGTYVFGT